MKWIWKAVERHTSNSHLGYEGDAACGYRRMGALFAHVFLVTPFPGPLLLWGGADKHVSTVDKSGRVCRRSRHSSSKQLISLHNVLCYLQQTHLGGVHPGCRQDLSREKRSFTSAVLFEIYNYLHYLPRHPLFAFSHDHCVLSWQLTGALAFLLSFMQYLLTMCYLFISPWAVPFDCSNSCCSLTARML